jgi:hypothetical protein
LVSDMPSSRFIQGRIDKDVGKAGSRLQGRRHRAPMLREDSDALGDQIAHL